MGVRAGGPSVSPANAEAIEAWDGPLFERLVRYRHIVVAGLKRFGDEAMRLHPPPLGARVLDVGCGFGDTTQPLAEFVGPDGMAVGVDAVASFHRGRARRGSQVGHRQRSLRRHGRRRRLVDEPFHYAFSRMGTMFFANPAEAMRNVREALVPGGQLVMVVWRAKQENESLYWRS